MRIFEFQRCAGRATGVKSQTTGVKSQINQAEYKGSLMLITTWLF